MEDNHMEYQPASFDSAGETKRKNLPGTKRSFFAGLFAGLLAGLLVFSVIVVHAMPSLFEVGRKSLFGGRFTSCVSEESIEKLQVLEEAIREVYYEPDELDTSELEQGLYKGLFAAINDPYSVYYSPEEATMLEESLSGQFGGIGAYISLDQTSGYPKIAGERRGEKS